MMRSIYADTSHGNATVNGMSNEAGLEGMSVGARWVMPALNRCAQDR